MVEAYPGYELVKNEIGGVAGYMALYKLASAPTMELATGRYPLTDYSGADVQNAMIEWRSKVAGARSHLTHKDLTSHPHWEMLRQHADFQVGTLAWSMLDEVEERSIEGILAGLGAALHIELRESPLSESEKVDLHGLREDPFDLALYLLGRLRGSCELRGMCSRVFIEQSLENLKDDPVGPIPEILFRVATAIRDRKEMALSEKPKRKKAQGSRKG